MDGIHDLGGKHGFGPVQRDADEAPGFRERWHAAVFSMTTVGPATRAWTNSDRFRHSIERIDPVAYLTHGYYGRWLGGIESMLVEAGVVSTQEITAKAVALGGHEDDPVAARPSVQPDPVVPGESRATAARDLETEPRFGIGAEVTTATNVHSGHTRLPAYARGKCGVVIACHAGWVFPDTNAHGRGESPQHLYTVQFTGETLWGDGAEPGTRVCLDLFEPYLEPTS